MESLTGMLPGLLEIIWLNIILSGDNAVVIGLAAAGLPAHQRAKAVLFGVIAAAVLRIVLSVFATLLLSLWWIDLLGGAALLYIAWNFWRELRSKDEEEEGHGKAAEKTIWQALWQIILADVSMSLDNVLAIAAAARGHFELFVFGLLLTIPLIIFGARLLSSVLERFPILIWLGAALLGWIAGEMLLSDMAVLQWMQTNMPSWVASVPPSDTNPIGLLPAKVPFYTAAVLGAAFVVVVGYVLKKKPIDQPG